MTRTKVAKITKLEVFKYSVYIFVAIVILLVVAGFGIGMTPIRQSVIDNVGLWNYLIGKWY